jgi:outer membrane protein OmpU
MKNILKTIAVLVSASLISVAAKAGELTVTGSAKASYMSHGGNDTGKAIGISNELNFTASGELDNGFTWTYHTELDPADGGAASNDDTAIVIGMGDLGTIGLYDAEGGLSTELGWGIGAVGVGADYANTMTNIGRAYDVSSDPHVTYTTAAGMLPFGIQAAIGFAPNTPDGQSNSYKGGGAQVDAAAAGTNATQYKVTAAPIDGLKIGADYYETGGNKVNNVSQHKSGGNVYAQYAMGNFKVGYTKGKLEPAKTTDKYGTDTADTATALGGDAYESDGFGIEFAVNDQLSVSITEEDFTRVAKTMAATASTNTRSEVTSSQTTIMAAYNIGGATLGLSLIDTDNSDYTANRDETKTIVSLALAF